MNDFKSKKKGDTLLPDDSSSLTLLLWFNASGMSLQSGTSLTCRLICPETIFKPQCGRDLQYVVFECETIFRE